MCVIGIMSETISYDIYTYVELPYTIGHKKYSLAYGNIADVLFTL